MPELSFPYAGGQGMTDASYEKLMSKVTGEGRIDLDVPGNSLQVPIIYADSTGRQFKVRANTAYLVRGFRWEAGPEGFSKSLVANNSGNPRLDLVVLRLNRANFQVRVDIIQGTPAAVPTLPTVTQSVGSTGVYEVPLASVRVASNGGVNLPSITSGDVNSYETWLGAPPMIGHSFARPAVKPGGIWTEYDTGRSYVGLSSKWYMFSEDATPYVKLSANGSWNADNFYVYVSRRNGWTHMQGLITRKDGLTDSAAGADVPIVTLADTYRPIGNLYVTGTMTGNTPVRIYIDYATGAVTLVDHAVLKENQFVHFGPLIWPSK